AGGRWDWRSGSRSASSRAASRDVDARASHAGGAATRLRLPCAPRMPIADKKAFLLRLDPAIWSAIERLAQAELRSVNAQIEFMLRGALALKARRKAKRSSSASASRPYSRLA